MKIINGKQLAHMPNGTVFSDITDSNFEPDGNNGDMTINGLHIMCGHDESDDYWSTKGGHFNGVLHMLDYVTCYETTPEDGGFFDEEEWNSTIDTDNNDYDENDWVVVYDENEVMAIIRNLCWALNGCKLRIE